MKKVIIVYLLTSLNLIYSCGTTKRISDRDAASALKEMLSIGVRQSVESTFSQQNVLSIFPDPVRKPLASIQQMGLSPDLDKFTVTMAKAAQISAERSVPIFLNAIDRINFTDAMQIIR